MFMVHLNHYLLLPETGHVKSQKLIHAYDLQPVLFTLGDLIATIDGALHGALHGQYSRPEDTCCFLPMPLVF